MNKGYLVLLFTLVSTVSLVDAQKAQAEGFQVKAKQLDKATWHKAPLQIQLIDNRPRVTDHRQASEEPTYLINVPPVQQGQSPTQVINVGGAPGSGGTLINASKLPAAGFGSNIPVGGTAKPNNLPSGMSTNRLAGTYKAPAAAQPGAFRPAQAKPGQARAPQAPVAMIVSRPTGGSVSGGTTTSANAYGKVLGRGSLLKSK